MRHKKSIISRHKKSRLAAACLKIFLLAFFIYGCSASRGALRLLPDDKGPDGYSRGSHAGVFENEHLKVTARQVNPVEFEDGPAILMDIIRKGYVILNLDIQNKSLVKVLYNPTNTIFTDDALDYRKPLDYTDFYDILKERDEKRISTLKGKFYDLDVTLLPGERSSKFLIFRPLSRGIKKAELTIQEIYIGTETVRISLPFSAKKEEI